MKLKSKKKTEKTLKPQSIPKKKPNYLINYIIHFIIILTFYKILKTAFISKYSKEMTKQKWIFDLMSPSFGIILLIIHCFYITLYYFKIPYFEKMKINNLKWPWEKNKKNFINSLKSIILIYIINQVFITNIFLYIFSNYFKANYTIESLPNIFEFWLGIIISMILEDFFFYWSHRFLHNPLFYNKIHKVHHKFYNVIHVSYAYSHPLEYLVGNILPNFFTILILGKWIHFITYVGFVWVRLMETCEGHCGYEFSFSMFAGFPFMTDSGYHNFHHLKNRGNYGSMFRIWDSVFKTNKYYYEVEGKGE